MLNKIVNLLFLPFTFAIRKMCMLFIKGLCEVWSFKRWIYVLKCLHSYMFVC